MHVMPGCEQPIRMYALIWSICFWASVEQDRASLLRYQDTRPRRATKCRLRYEEPIANVVETLDERPKQRRLQTVKPKTEVQCRMSITKLGFIPNFPVPKWTAENLIPATTHRGHIFLSFLWYQIGPTIEPLRKIYHSQLALRTLQANFEMSINS